MRRFLHHLLGVLLAGHLGCGYLHRAANFFDREPTLPPRGQASEEVEHQLDLIGTPTQASWRQTRSLDDARLHHRLLEIFALPARWLSATRLAEERLDQQAVDLRLEAVAPTITRPNHNQVALMLTSPELADRLGALEHLESNAQRLLVTALADRSPAVRAEAARTLSQADAVREALVHGQGTRVKPFDDELCKALQSAFSSESDAIVRRAQLQAIAQLGEQQAWPFIRQALVSDVSALVKVRAAELLLASSAPESVDLLLEQLAQRPANMVSDQLADLLAARTGIAVPMPSMSVQPLDPGLLERLRAKLLLSDGKSPQAD